MTYDIFKDPAQNPVLHIHELWKARVSKQDALALTSSKFRIPVDTLQTLLKVYARRVAMTRKCYLSPDQIAVAVKLIVKDHTSLDKIATAWGLNKKLFYEAICTTEIPLGINRSIFAAIAQLNEIEHARRIDFTTRIIKSKPVRKIGSENATTMFYRILRRVNSKATRPMPT